MLAILVLALLLSVTSTPPSVTVGPLELDDWNVTAATQCNAKFANDSSTRNLCLMSLLDESIVTASPDPETSRIIASSVARELVSQAAVLADKRFLNWTPVENDLVTHWGDGWKISSFGAFLDDDNHGANLRFLVENGGAEKPESMHLLVRLSW